MNTSFKQRRGRIGALTLVLAGLFAFAMLRLIVLVAFDGARLNSLAVNEHSGETKLAQCADRSSIATENRLRSQPRRARYTRGRIECSR